jgi:hypothetical protein
MDMDLDISIDQQWPKTQEFGHDSLIPIMGFESIGQEFYAVFYGPRLFGQNLQLFLYSSEI